MTQKNGWVFPVPEQVRAFESSLPVDGSTLLQTLFVAVESAWMNAIEPQMKDIRSKNIASDSRKSGIDFFTQADTKAEEILRTTIVSTFGENTFRIWGEEANAYLGNPDAELTVRIDPIDSTENFKFGKPQWSIMVGIYTGRGTAEHQVMSVAYYPEYYKEVLYFIEGVGIFITNLAHGNTEEIASIDIQDDVSEIYTVVSRDNNELRGTLDAALLELERKGARVKSTSTIEAKEALQTRGRRAIIANTLYGQQDYIAYSVLATLGYKTFDWRGEERRIDDPGLAGIPVLIVPPGKAGEGMIDTFSSFFK